MSKAMTQSYIFISILGLTVLPIVSAQSDESIMIHQEIEFNATPQQLYDALLDSKQFSEFSGRVAEINREVGGAFPPLQSPYRRAKRGTGSESKDRSSLARGDVARRRVLHCEIRAKAARIGNAPRVGSYRFSGGPARPSCCGMGRELLVVAQETFPLATGAILEL